jgi:hypothetical protein
MSLKPAPTNSSLKKLFQNSRIVRRWINGKRKYFLRGKFIPYGTGVFLLGNNKIERYHSEIARNIRSMHRVKNSENRSFQVYNFVDNFFRKDRVLNAQQI